MPTPAYIGADAQDNGVQRDHGGCQHLAEEAALGQEAAEPRGRELGALRVVHLGARGLDDLCQERALHSGVCIRHVRDASRAVSRGPPHRPRAAGQVLRPIWRAREGLPHASGPVVLPVVVLNLRLGVLAPDGHLGLPEVLLVVEPAVCVQRRRRRRVADAGAALRGRRVPRRQPERLEVAGLRDGEVRKRVLAPRGVLRTAVVTLERETRLDARRQLLVAGGRKVPRQRDV
mmetsp:Transcript_106922/g.307513  ORF Transcript_106922/g.307513 Transcript_106922/m.307513 type:complete len:232 (+) Transcript_106922:1271-1966(+)